MTDGNLKSAAVVDLNRVKKAGKKDAKKGAKCPICGKPTEAAYRPFCSKRCADIDLGKWLGEGYRIPTDEVPGMDGGFDDED